MRALIVADSGNNLTPYVVSSNIRTLYQALTNRGVSVTLLSADNLIYYEHGLEVPELTYIAHPLQPQHLSLAQNIRDRGSLVINSPESIVFCSNKLNVANRLIESGIPHPRTVLLTPDMDYSTLDIGWPCVVKPSNRWSGHGIALCETPEDIAAQVTEINRLIRFDENARIIAQEYILSGEGHLVVGSYVVGDKVSSLATIGDPTSPNKFMSALRAGNHRIPINTPPELLSLISNIKTALNIEVFRLETFLTNQGYMVCEVNVPGGRLGHDAVIGFDLSNVLADYLIRRFEEQ